MFRSNQLEMLKARFKTFTIAPADFEGPSKRTTHLMPSIKLGQPDDLKETERRDPSRLLISIEADERSCCLQIESDYNKSRAAILVHRGRVLGAIYGCKSMSHQLFHRKAVDLAIRDLAGRSGQLTLYSLSDEVVAAAAALFHGNVLELPDSQDTRFLFDLACATLSQIEKPGTVVLGHSRDQALCMVYFYAGKIVGAYSDRAGRLATNLKKLRDYVAHADDLEISGCILPVNQPSDIHNLAFSLSGLADRPLEAPANEVDFAIPNFFQYYNVHKAEVNRRMLRSNSLIISRNRTPAKEFDSNAARRSSYRIEP